LPVFTEKVTRLKEERQKIINEHNDGGVILNAKGRVVGTTSPMKNKPKESSDSIEKVDKYKMIEENK
jgi:cytochrome oxidase Cu insertion factor (SCO1/SenC/PrrC family)